MICRFCSQWNPESAGRCCFCDNVLDGTQDTTRDGQPAYLRNTGRQLQVPRAQRSMYDPRPQGMELDLSGLWRKGGKDRMLLVAGVVIAVVILLGMVIRSC